jgi:antibiotic biosynthesis monooxygenase (ABM) superfamily enzyme
MSSQVPKPKRWKLMLLTWLFVYPIINLLFLLLMPIMKEWHQLLKTLVLTLILVPMLGFFLPIIHRKLWNWIIK